MKTKEEKRAYQAEWRRKNLESVRASSRAWAARNKETLEKNYKQWAEKNPDKIKKKMSLWKKNNRSKCTHWENMRRANKINATPKWADLEAIKEFYMNCPPGYHVDHIIPLNHPDICGLHVLENLQYLPAIENLKKSNKLQIKQVDNRNL